jgi:hypothetical protein
VTSLEKGGVIYISLGRGDAVDDLIKETLISIIGI